VLGLALPLAFAPNDASAHRDPPGCLGIDNSMRLTVTRNDGSPVSGTVSECETLKYQAELEWDDECLIQGGTFKLVTPDGMEHVIANPVPCLGDATVDAEGCLEFQATSVLSPIIDYQASPGDAVAGKLTAMAVWENGFLHQNTGNVSGQGDMRAIVVDIEFCDDGLFCTGTEFCDPAATDGISLGLCQPGTPPDCGTSDECTDRGCNEDTNMCDVIDTSGRCGASDFCVERGCNPESGCFTTDNSETLCPDEFCTERECNPETGQCDVTDVSDKCGPGDECMDLICNEATDMCDVVDTSGRCGTSDFCVERGCNPESGCFTTDNSETLCPDEFCTERTCNPATSQCDEMDVSAKCGTGDECTDRVCNEDTNMCETVDTSDRCEDGNPCTIDGCDPERGCVVESEVVCNGDDPCIPLVCNPETGQCEENGGNDTPFFIKASARFGNGATIAGGLGVNEPGGRLRLGRSVIMTNGAVLKGDIVSVGNGSSVNDVFTNQLLLPRDNSATVNGIVGPIELPLEEFFCPIPEFTCGGPSVLVPPGGTLGPLDPGTYGDVRILNGGSLTLKKGTFNFCDFRTGRNVNVRTTGGGTSTINVDGKFRLANGSFMGPDNASQTPFLNVTGRRVRIGAGSTLQAHVSAPDALISLGRGARLTGTFCACRGRSDKNITLECPPFVPSPSGAFLNPLY
jgi:hypothetical protein